MDWKFIITLVGMVGFGITTIVLAARLARRKKPAWAYKTTRIIGLGTNAPPELRLTFDGKVIINAYSTIFIFFNKGNETIRKDDVTENVTMHFKGAEVLRQPTIIMKSKEAIEFSAKQIIRDGDNCVESDFKYLDHNDGGVVEVLHTESKKITCSGNIMGAKELAYIGEFISSRPKLRYSRFISGGIMLLIPLAIIISLMLAPELNEPESEFMIWSTLAFTLVFWFIFSMSEIRPFFRYRKFPSWSFTKQ